jgi:hypothetical protein
MKTIYSISVAILAFVLYVPPAAAQVWGIKIDGSSRFRAVLGGAAVLDLETLLVWEKSPNNTATNWYTAHSICVDTVVGGRKGWRLPTIVELGSLIDPTQTFPALPVGHPFVGVIISTGPGTGYWSATNFSGAGALDSARIALLGPGSLFNVADDKNNYQHVWCVRGGNGFDEQKY